MVFASIYEHASFLRAEGERIGACASTFLRALFRDHEQASTHVKAGFHFSEFGRANRYDRML